MFFKEGMSRRLSNTQGDTYYNDRCFKKIEQCSKFLYKRIKMIFHIISPIHEIQNK